VLTGSTHPRATVFVVRVISIMRHVRPGQNLPQLLSWLDVINQPTLFDA
jgi:hypothetical protein